MDPDLLLYVVSRGSWRAGNYNGNAPPANNANKFYAEKVTDVELGSKLNGQLADRPLRLNVALYDENADGLQRDVYLTLGGAPASFTHNVPQGETKGIEVDGEFQATNWLKLGAAGAYTYANYPEPNVSVYGQSLTFSTYPDTPRLSGSVYGQVVFPVPEEWGAMSVRADLYGQAGVYFTGLAESISPGTRLPGYGLLNLRYDWQEIFGSQASLGLYVRNLLDHEYFQGGFANGPSAGVNVASPGVPQMFGMELTYTF